MVKIVEVWPSPFGIQEPSELFRRLRGATIVRIGKPENVSLEGGGLAIEYREASSNESKIVVLEFNDAGMWESNLPKPVPSPT